MLMTLIYSEPAFFKLLCSFEVAALLIKELLVIKGRYNFMKLLYSCFFPLTSILLTKKLLRYIFVHEIAKIINVIKVKLPYTGRPLTVDFC